MSFNNFSSSVKLNNIKTYNRVNTSSINSFKNTFYSDIKDINYSAYEDIDYNSIDLEKGIEKAEEPDGWDKFLNIAKDTGATAVTLIASAVEGFLNLGEGVIDAHIYGVAKTLQVFGVDDKWSEDIISYDVSGELYDSFVGAVGIEEDIAYGWAKSTGNFVGEMVGYYALSSVPFVGPALSCIGGAGKAVEENINTQKETTGEVNDWKVFGASALGALEGYGFGKASKAASTGIKAVAKTGIKATAKQTIGAFGKGAIKTTLKNSGKTIAKNAALNTLKDSDTWIETGAVLMDDVSNGIETGEWDVIRMAGGTATVFAGNYVGNLAGGIAGDVIENSKKIDITFSDNDVTALLQDAETSDYYSKWRKRDLSDWAHKNFDGIYGSEQIDNIMNRVNKVSDNYWPTLLKQKGLPETTKGFVDADSNLFLPQSANEHSAYHELFHQLSEINGNNKGLKYTDVNGNLRKVTGIREFYEDGFNSTWANETLTDFLASKYSDGKIYESIYSKQNVKLWSRLDDAMTAAYGDAGSNLLVNSYLSNDTTAIRKFFDTYSKSGSYDDFVRTMQNFDIKSLDSMVSGIEKNVYKQHNSFGAKIKSLFGGK